MKAGVFRAREADEFFIRERAHILEVTTPEEDPEVTVARARVEAGVMTALHALEGVDERYLIVAGQGEVQVGENGQWTGVRSGDVVAIPANTPQRIRNTGSEDLVFYCICSPPFETSSYRHLE